MDAGTTDNEEYTAYKIRDDGDTEASPDDGYYAEELVSDWEKKSKRDSLISFLKENGLFLIGICLAVVILFMLYQGLPKSPFSTHTNEIMALEERLNAVEERIQQDNGTPEKTDTLQISNQQIEQLIKRVGRLESTVKKQREEIAKRLVTIEEKVALVGARDKVSKPKTKSANTSATRYHTVKTGDTLYGIGKKYGLSINELRRLNKLSAKSTIRPGQRLRVSR